MANGQWLKARNHGPKLAVLLQQGIDRRLENDLRRGGDIDETNAKAHGSACIDHVGVQIEWSPVRDLQLQLHALTGGHGFNRFDEATRNAQVGDSHVALSGLAGTRCIERVRCARSGATIVGSNGGDTHDDRDVALVAAPPSFHESARRISS